MSDEEYLDTRAPDIAFYALLGQVNYVWAQLDAVSSAAFASLLNLDPAELGIAIGRIETQAKIERMHAIARRRRNDDLSDLLTNIKSELNRLRPLRNAVMHGAYMGSANQDELCFRLSTDFIVAEDEQTAQKMFVLTIAELQQHVIDIAKIAASLSSKFDVREMLDLPTRVRQTQTETKRR